MEGYIKLIYTIAITKFVSAPREDFETTKHLGVVLICGLYWKILSANYSLYTRELK